MEKYNDGPKIERALKNEFGCRTKVTQNFDGSYGILFEKPKSVKFGSKFIPKLAKSISAKKIELISAEVLKDGKLFIRIRRPLFGAPGHDEISTKAAQVRTSAGRYLVLGRKNRIAVHRKVLDKSATKLRFYCMTTIERWLAGMLRHDSFTLKDTDSIRTACAEKLAEAHELEKTA